MLSTTEGLIIFHFLFTIACGTEIDKDVTLHRSKRQLLYPNSTLLQLNIGVATPSPRQLINVNWAIQANFQLPWNRSQIPVDILHANSGYEGDSRKVRDLEMKDYENDARLYHFYRYVEGVLNGFGHNGTTCVLRTLCQLGAEPLETNDEEDLLHEIAGFVLNPKNDDTHTAYKSEIQPYIEAYERGEDLQNCSDIYKPCSVSLIDYFTKPHQTL